MRTCVAANQSRLENRPPAAYQKVAFARAMMRGKPQGAGPNRNGACPGPNCQVALVLASLATNLGTPIGRLTIALPRCVPDGGSVSFDSSAMIHKRLFVSEALGPRDED